MAVHPYLCGVVDCAEVQQPPRRPVRRRVKGTPIPDDLVHFLTADSAQLTLIGERNDNGAIEGGVGSVVPFFGLSGVLVVKGKLPGAVEVLPRLAHKLWARVLRAWDRLIGVG